MKSKKVLSDLDLSGNKITDTNINSDEVHLYNFDKSKSQDTEISSKDTVTVSIEKLDRRIDNIDNDISNVYTKDEVNNLIQRSIINALITPV